MKLFRRVIATASMAALMLEAGCGAGGRGLVSKSPGDAVKAAYMAANAGEYSEAEKYVSTDVLNAWARSGGMKSEWDRITRDGTIDRIEILKEEIRGEGAKVSIRIHFKDGQTKNDNEPLIKQSGEWKITAG